MGEVLAIRHVAFEDLGLLAPLLEERGHRVRTLEAPSDALDAVDPLAPALVVVLGGPIGAEDDAEHPFLRHEAALLERRLRAERPVLGICLGAQLLARALGARVGPSPEKEIGWAPVELTAAGRRGPLRHLEATPVLHWHGDAFELPAGAVPLASTKGCPQQAFAWGETALALQFHAEAAGPPLERWLVGHAHEIRHTPGVSVAGLRADTERCSPGLVPAARACFAEWLEGAGL